MNPQPNREVKLSGRATVGKQADGGGRESSPPASFQTIQNMEAVVQIHRGGSGPTSRAPEETFTGDVCIRSYFRRGAPSRWPVRPPVSPSARVRPGAPPVDHAGLSSAAMQQVMGREPSFGHSQARAREDLVAELAVRSRSDSRGA